MWVNAVFFPPAFIKFANSKRCRLACLLNSKLAEWGFISTENNPADLCSRGTHANDPKLDYYSHGLEYLRLDESEWPTSRPDVLRRKKKPLSPEEIIANNEVKPVVGEENVPPAETAVSDELGSRDQDVRTDQHTDVQINCLHIDEEMVSIASRDAGYSPLELLAIGATHVEPEWSVEERSEISKEHWCLRVASKPGDWGEKRWRVAMFKRFLIKSAQRLSERKI